MARIEISLLEYNALTDKIKSLEKLVVKKDNEISLYEEKVNKIKDAVEDALEESLFNRMFSWKKIKKGVYDLF
jgi:hypothetical protein